MSCNSFVGVLLYIDWNISTCTLCAGLTLCMHAVNSMLRCRYMHLHTHVHTLTLHAYILTHTHTPREQEDMIKSLRASQLELEAENEALKNANTHLHIKTHDPPPSVVADHAYEPHPPQPDLNSSGESSSSLPRNPSITRLVAHLDVDLSSLPTTGGQGGVATATATVPIKFDSSYRAAMEKGL